MPQIKTCKNCKEAKPLEEFYECDSCVDGHRGECKKCMLLQQQKKYVENREKRLEKAAKYRETHREKINQYFRDRYKANSRQILDSRKEYNEAHREERKAYLKKYYRKNKERLAKQNYGRQRRRIQNDPIYKLKRQVGLLIWRSFNQRSYVKPAHSEEILGCKLDKFTTYLKQTWLKEYGTEWTGQPCHIDHIVPLATAKTKENVIKLCHYTNLRLLTPEDNMEKSDSLDYAISNNLIKEEE